MSPNTVAAAGSTISSLFRNGTQPKTTHWRTSPQDTKTSPQDINEMSFDNLNVRYDVSDSAAVGDVSGGYSVRTKGYYEGLNLSALSNAQEVSQRMPPTSGSSSRKPKMYNWQDDDFGLVEHND